MGRDRRVDDGFGRSAAASCHVEGPIASSSPTIAVKEGDGSEGWRSPAPPIGRVGRTTRTPGSRVLLGGPGHPQRRREVGHHPQEEGPVVLLQHRQLTSRPADHLRRFATCSRGRRGTSAEASGIQPAPWCSDPRHAGPGDQSVPVAGGPLEGLEGSLMADIEPSVPGRATPISTGTAATAASSTHLPRRMTP
jgi:hypothetical protein